ncbi:MAG TPA: class II aldolase/adducin family protein [Kiritimatiellae bacterium]|nr:class II aldolase/adducin family protein [Kiritimatiellia bacterium]
MSREFTGSEGMQEKLSHYARRVAEKGLAAGAGGNLSVCVDNTVWISRSGIALEDMRPGDFAPVDLRTGRPLRRDIRPSSETGTHLAIYRARDDIRAVVHVHPPFVTGLASAGVDFSTFTFEAVLDLGPVDILPLVPPGSSELAERVGRSAAGHDVILLSNHGMMVMGRTMRQAYYRCCILEQTAIAFLVAYLVAGSGVGGIPADMIRELSRDYRACARRRIIEEEE